MRTRVSSSTNRPRLTLIGLEGRLVPAASVVTATPSATGLLTIIGDDQANSVIIKVSGGDTVLTPDANTDINGAGAGTAVTLTGFTPESLKVDLNGGGDVLTIDGGTAFVL